MAVITGVFIIPGIKKCDSGLFYRRISFLVQTQPATALVYTQKAGKICINRENYPHILECIETAVLYAKQTWLYSMRSVGSLT